MNKFWLVLTTLLTFLGVSSIHAQSQIPLPSFSDGDYWKLKSVTKQVGISQSPCHEAYGDYIVKIASGQPKVFVPTGDKESEIVCPVVAETLLGTGRKRFGLPFPLTADGKARSFDINEEAPTRRITITVEKDMARLPYQEKNVPVFSIKKITETTSGKGRGDAEVIDNMKYSLLCKCNMVMDLSRVGKNYSIYRTITVVDFMVAKEKEDAASLRP